MTSQEQELLDIPSSTDTAIARNHLAWLLQGQVTDNFAVAEAIDTLIACKLADFLEFAAARVEARASLSKGEK